jgi:hypothetical protein
LDNIVDLRSDTDWVFLVHEMSAGVDPAQMDCRMISLDLARIVR